MQGLRLHDNPALLEAVKSEQLFPVFCLDPWFMTQDRVGVNRMRFLLESLEDLHSSLQGRDSGLLVFSNPCLKPPSNTPAYAEVHCLSRHLQVLKGKPDEVFPRLWKEWGISKLCFEVDTEPYAEQRDTKIRQLAKDAGTASAPHS